MNIQERKSVIAWLDSLSDPMPIVAVPHNPAESSLKKLIKESPGIHGTTIEALVWLRLGLIDPAHRIVQEATRGLDAYVHGVVHRLEGDYWNSKYWFRRVQDSELSSFIASHVPSTKSFDPERFVDECEAASRDIKQETIMVRLKLVTLAEWQALWDWCIRSDG